MGAVRRRVDRKAAPREVGGSGFDAPLGQKLCYLERRSGTARQVLVVAQAEGKLGTPGPLDTEDTGPGHQQLAIKMHLHKSGRCVSSVDAIKAKTPPSTDPDRGAASCSRIIADKQG